MSIGCSTKCTLFLHRRKKNINCKFSEGKNDKLLLSFIKVCISFLFIFVAYEIEKITFKFIHKAAYSMNGSPEVLVQ